MGSGIATALILSNYPVILKEVNEKFLEAGIGRVKGKPGIYNHRLDFSVLYWFINDLSC